jgi:uncharacterized membrane protein YeaQ/YmgE (transglycosylase-associated protein family)
VTRAFMGDNPGNNGFIASFVVALLGACLVIGIWKAIAGRRRV